MDKNVNWRKGEAGRGSCVNGMFMKTLTLEQGMLLKDVAFN